MNMPPNDTKIIDDPEERARIVEHVLRYELYRHRDISDRLRNLLSVTENPNAFNRSTWDILYFLMQSHLLGVVPSVTDIYLATGLSKGTAITGLAELERRHAIAKVRDHSDGRRRRIDISKSVADELEKFIAECGERLGQPFDTPAERAVTRMSTSDDQEEPLIGLLNQLSHELRTPLTAIVGFSEMIADETLGPVHPVGYAEYARDIRFAASHLLDAMNNLVDTTLAEYGVNIPLGQLNQIDVEEIVDKACRAAAGNADRRGVTLRRKWGSAKGRVLGDEDRLTQGIRKLIVATIESTGRGQTVDVETSFEDTSGLTLQVISPEAPVVPKTSQVQRPIGAPEQDGLVRGLPLIRAIVEAHGGDVGSKQDGPRRFVTMIRLPKDGPAKSA